ncbi:MAG: hypothetical protein IKU11_04460 [Clostridia bacterium]|nr:hypothetical protein [Clostridia bacterium]
MTKRERVIAAMHNQPVDRPPVGFWFHFKPEQAKGQPCVQAHLDYYNRIDTDIAKLMCDGYFDYPNPVAKNIKDAKDWYDMKPLGPESDFIREQVERVKAVKAGLQSDCLVLYNVFAPFSTLRFGAGDEIVMAHLKEDPAAIAYALEVVAKDNALLCELLFTEAGVDGIYYCVQGGEKDRFTPAEYREYVTPSDLAVLEHANKFGDLNVLHCCGWAGIPNHMEVWQDYPAKAINWACFVENMNLTEGKAFFGGKCVLGGFDNRAQSLIVNGTREEIEEYTRTLVEKAGKTGVMIGADCTLPGTIDVERIGWVVDAAKAL